MKKQQEVTEKTRQRFVDAFWSLAEEKAIPKISVSELAKRAGYNRSTFYEYFLDIDDLVSYIEKRLLEEVQQTIVRTLPQMETPDSLIQSNLFQTIFAAMNEKIYLLLGPNGDPAFPSKIKTELMPAVVSQLSVSINLPNIDYLISFVNSAAFGLVQYWNEQGKNIPPEEISTMMQNLVLHGLAAYLEPAADHSALRPAVSP